MRPTNRHDVVIVPDLSPDAEAGEPPIYRVKHEQYLQPDYRLRPGQRGFRKLRNAATAGAERGTLRGPAFAVLPTKEDPVSQFGTCYLINAKNLNAGNPWTWAPWNDGPGGADEAFNVNPWVWNDDGFEVLLAGPGGLVFHVSKPPHGRPEIERVDLEGEAEIWSALRSGTVAGRVRWAAKERVIALVNVTALTPPPPENVR